MSGSFDRHARIVIVGGGAIGCAVAYALTRRGERDVLLLEKSQITNGCTWHAAGLVGQLRGRKNLTRLMQNSVAVFDRLEAEAGQAIDWRKVGSLRLASSADRWSEIRRSMTLAKSFGFECHSLTAKEAVDLFPYIDPEGVVGAAFIPSDGYIDPYALTRAFASAARKNGATLQEGTTVTGILKDGRKVVGVITDHGTVGCEYLVNCAGLWAKRIAEMAGVALAAGVVEHQYFIHREETRSAEDAPDAPRSRQELLSQARRRRFRDRRMVPRRYAMPRRPTRSCHARPKPASPEMREGRYWRLRKARPTNRPGLPRRVDGVGYARPRLQIVATIPIVPRKTGTRSPSKCFAFGRDQSAAQGIPGRGRARPHCGEGDWYELCGLLLQDGQLDRPCRS